MDFSSALKELKLDYWYKVFVVLGAIVLVTSLFVPLAGIAAIQPKVQLISLGALLVGLGEWNNHREEHQVIPPNLWTTGGATLLATRVVWRLTLIGFIFDIAGLALIVVGIVGIVNAPVITPVTPTIP